MRTRTVFIVTILIGCVVAVSLSFYYWMHTQPVTITPNASIARMTSDGRTDTTIELPVKNSAMLKFIERYGAEISPTYYQAVCTEFVISVLEKYTPMNATIKRDIRIITNDNLETLIDRDADVIKGVQYALVKAGVGTVVEPRDALPGDLVQFWYTTLGSASGHCGFVVESKPNDQLTLYSSHPITGGFGQQRFPWPDKVYFVRLN